MIQDVIKLEPQAISAALRARVSYSTTPIGEHDAGAVGDVRFYYIDGVWYLAVCVQPSEWKKVALS